MPLLKPSCLLAYPELCEEIVDGLVVRNRDGSPVPYSLVNAASIDIRLGRAALRETYEPDRKVLDYRARAALPTYRIDIDPDAGLVLAPGEFLLTESEEMFYLPTHLSFEYKLKSSMARLGLEHLTAGWADAGWHGSVLTLELKNMSQYNAIRIRPGDAIGQLTFFRHTPVPDSASYAARGRYNNDLSVTPTKATP